MSEADKLCPVYLYQRAKFQGQTREQLLSMLRIEMGRQRCNMSELAEILSLPVGDVEAWFTHPETAGSSDIADIMTALNVQMAPPSLVPFDSAHMAELFEINELTAERGVRYVFGRRACRKPR